MSTAGMPSGKDQVRTDAAQRERMSALRDEFAKAALSGMLANMNLSNAGDKDFENIGVVAYAISDAMLKARGDVV